MIVRPIRIDEALWDRIQKYLAKTPNITYSSLTRQAVIEFLDRKEKEHDELPANP